MSLRLEVRVFYISSLFLIRSIFGKFLLFVFDIYEKSAFALIDLNGDSLGARTPDPLVKSQMGMIQIIQYSWALLKTSAFFIRQIYDSNDWEFIA